MEIAYAQHRSVEEAQAANPSSHLPLWATFLERKSRERTADHYYLALIAAEVRRTRAKNPKRVSLKDLLLKFTPAGRKSQGGITDPAQSKSIWMALFGMNRDGQPLAGSKPPSRRRPPAPPPKKP